MRRRLYEPLYRALLARRMLVTLAAFDYSTAFVINIEPSANLSASSGRRWEGRRLKSRALILGELAVLHRKDAKLGLKSTSEILSS
ncbi:hypothetical protein Trydic_g17509 [Trypoxylus dichotomus]